MIWINFQASLLHILCELSLAAELQCSTKSVSYLQVPAQAGNSAIALQLKEMRCGEVKQFLQEIISYIHSQSCNSLLKFALFINNKNFEVSGLILESKLLLKLLFVRKTSEIIPLPLILRTKRRLFSTVMAGGFQCFHQNGKTGNSSMYENVFCLQV